MALKIPVCSPLLSGNEATYVSDAVSSGWISSSGKYVTEFEQKFAEYCGVKHGIAVCNGTVSLHLALVALGIGEGDEVIIPDFTMAACAFSVCYTGAKPVFVDADVNTWNIDSAKIEEKISSRTKAIMPVHIFGNPCDMQSIRNIAEHYNLLVLEDAAQAHGASYNGAPVGSIGEIASFSFFANKNITTGEGGMVVTDSDELADRCRYYKNLCFPLHGARNYLHENIGFNYRMSNLHAAVGLAQVEKADYYKHLRIKNGKLYKDLLTGISGINLQHIQPGGECVYWMNGLCINPKEYGRTRDELMNQLLHNGVESRLFFQGMHRQTSLKSYGCECSDSYPVSDNLADNGFYLPSGSGLSETEIEYICKIIKKFSK